MSSQVIIVEKRSDFRWPDPDKRVMTAQDFIAEGKGPFHRPRRIVNLCRGYDYLSIGYYVSLLAEARGDRVTPSVETITGMQQKSACAPKLASLGRALGPLGAVPRSVDAMSVQVYFGQAGDAELAELATRGFETFRCPLLAIDLERLDGGEGWKVANLRPLDPRDIDVSRDAVFLDGLGRFSRRPWRATPAASGPRMDLAILHDPADPMPPSNLQTLQAIGRIGQGMDIAVELIEKKDFSRLTQFDALFIRETTAIAHHTFRFARKAANEGMPVIDDPDSILRCTNKAFLSEILLGNQVATPKTLFVTRRTLARFEGGLAYPVVLKVPDGAFSLGVKKAESWAEFEHMARMMLKHSEIILVQEFIYTPFDWRIGVLAGEVIFAAKYHMSEGHWQIIQHDGAGGHVEGRTQAVAVEEVPAEVIGPAVRAARLIGNGLYGVDLKQTRSGVVVIEINDNPNIDIGLEDAAVGEALYRTLLAHFQALVDARHRALPARPGMTGPSPGPKLVSSRPAAPGPLAPLRETGS
ncbi:RimK family protein [Labrys monachus]|uniref:Glutathione synthase/RimK-type ligase-like ATP-grasp enzyme n=1 Tax=Labrys monachus TaxID=217067 RepID=A0ABU0FE62_9HYPH|nr:RimK family protein [Labrys monachus]MDQ0392597.1 glutathione synthase/RimK-type ligase-like ATP-grasp enzyme [Labrys monachus]